MRSGLAFPDRKVEPVLIKAPVKGTPELELADKLEAYCALREDRLHDEPMRIRNASAFLRSGLQQRLLSSVEAFWRTLVKHKRTIDEQRQQHGERRRIGEADLDEHALAAIGGGLDADDDVEQEFDLAEPSTGGSIEEPATVEAERQTERATLATLGNLDHPSFGQEMKLLAEMLEMAEWARHKPDEKLKELFAYIDRNMFEAARSRLFAWDNLECSPHSHLHRIRRHARVRPARARGPYSIFGCSRSAIGDLQGINRARRAQLRQEIKEAFNADPAVNPVRILLATDAAREGINLQKHCFNLFHYDIPWNPARLEQRNGRIDRKLQPAPTVYCRYFLYENREEDAILRKIVEKTEKIYRELGGFGTVLDKNLIQTLRRRGIERSRVRETVQMLDFRDDEEDELAALALAEVSGEEDDLGDGEAGPPSSPEESARERIDRKRRDKLEKSNERLRKIFEESRRWLDLRESAVPRRPGLFATAHGGRGRADARTDRAPQGTEVFPPDNVAGEESHLARDAQQPSCPASAWRRSRLVVCPVSDSADRFRRSGRSLISGSRRRTRTGNLGSNRFTCILSTGSVRDFWGGSSPRGSCTTTFREPVSSRRRARCRWST